MRKVALVVVALVLVQWAGYGAEATLPSGAEAFVRQVVQSLLAGGEKVTFQVAEKVFAMDNGEVLSREDVEKGWPELAKRALKKTVTVDEFFRDVQCQVGSPADNKRLMSNKRLLDVYKYQDGDLHVDLSHAKEGMEAVIGYDKAFIYIIRNVQGKWTLIGIGG